MSRLLQRIVHKLKHALTKDELVWSVYKNYETFDKSKANPALLEKTLKKGCDAFEKIGIKYWLGRGSVLGLYRDGKFLPNDIDIDIDIEGDVDLFRLIQQLPGFEVFYVGHHKGHFQTFSLLDTETNIILDIWYYHRSADRVINRNYYGYFWLPTNMIDNLILLEFNGRKYPCPDPETFCAFWYGDKWRTPASYNKDWTIDYRRDCKGFVYLGEKDIIQIDCTKKP